MPSTAATEPTTPKKVLAAIHNLPKRMRSGTLRTQPARSRALGKENVPPGEMPSQPAAPHVFAPPLPSSFETPTDEFGAKDGKIAIKVWVPTTDDIWKLRVPEDVRLESFRTRVSAKVGFEVSFSALICGTLKTIGDDQAFREWVEGRLVSGRNSLLTAHRLVLQ
ncbi:hypothetical protein DICSQDRAFT_54487 [Dichomitus squalens LYAD-421 SS1]|uniref:Uncharacterized protein n=1 Tax=Dichomitus squalens TaxID=114155 RepID=A0A4Q9M989_9APHY|nr:uncharacterized protein DICSQDRAFT_54487 [Dichomitus squalens LYAD-421 SS1]EJF63793.1 hypothetical protein DICSQDRAFT_54487 [Dichomitus squalens LYAD-421 SS1]TBU23655.1 hypothetical protein BD311DRAFT_673502 [Dichomitus squalens]